MSTKTSSEQDRFLAVGKAALGGDMGASDSVWGQGQGAEVDLANS